jgi:hypothetical protein
MSVPYIVNTGHVSIKFIAITTGLVFIFGGCGLLSLTHKNKPVETSVSEAEKDDNKDYYEYFKLRNGIISPVIYSDVVKNKTEIFIGIMSPERWSQARVNLKINNNDSLAAEKLLNSEFKPSFFYLTEVNTGDPIDENYYINRIGESIQVTGYKFTFDSRPYIADYLKPAYTDGLPILIEEAPSGALSKGYGILLIGIVLVVVPLWMMYRKYMES